MKHLMIPLLLAGSFIALSTMEASAVVCARGVVRAGCVAAGGAAVVARPVVRPATGVVRAHGLLSVLLPVLFGRRGGWLFGAGCTDNPVTHQLKTCRANNARQSVCGRTPSNAYSGFEIAADWRTSGGKPSLQ